MSWIAGSYDLRSRPLSVLRAAGIVAVVALGACGGGGGGNDDVASLGTGDAVSTETTVPAADQDKITAYTACPA